MSDPNDRFDPQQELTQKHIPCFYRHYTLAALCAFLSLFILWAICCRSCIKIDPARTAGFGSGGADFGNGPGSGNAGDGPGAGENGDNTGKYAQAKGASGIGKTVAAAGTDTPATGRYAVDGAPSTPKLPVLDQPALHIESIAQEKPPVPQAKIFANKFTGGSPMGRKGFYGVKVNKRAKILFIVDCSGSMGVASAEISGKSRLDVMKMELKKTIFGSGRYSSGAFAIISFSDGTQQFPSAGQTLCRYTNSKRLKEAEDFIEKLSDNGGTNMKTAWLAGIKIMKEHKIDAVYFLTDGDPGDGFNPAWLKSVLKQNNISSRLQINCVVIGTEGQNLMKQIAGDHNGSCVFIQ